MRRLALAASQRIDRAVLDERYRETQLVEGVLSIVPPLVERSAAPPTVVKWWYAGSDEAAHRLVYRRLTWDAEGNPIGNEQRYAVARDALQIPQPFAYTNRSALWQPLHEAAPAIEPPPDLPTARQAPKPVENNPVRRPDDAVIEPPTID